MVKPTIAIIGAGLSGLSLANGLKEHASVTIFEKAGGVGGRMSTRYADNFHFDHGAQFFTARSKSFQRFLKPFIEKQIVQEWHPKIVTLEVGKKAYKRDWFEPHYVASSKMNMLCKTLSKEADVRLNVQIAKLTRELDGWFLSDSYQEERYGPFDWVVSSAPAPQTQVLFPQDFAEHELIENKKMQGCYSLMLGFPEDLKLNWNAAKIKNSPIGWIAVNSSKPLRDSGYSLLVQTTNEWAESNIETDQNTVQALLVEELGTLLQRNIRDAVYKNLHRWRYANTVVDEDLENNGYCMDEKLQLAACGDWCIGRHVESAYLSGCALSLALKKNIKWK